MKKSLNHKVFCGLVLLLFYSSTSKAQFSLTGQLRTRSELRDGQGTLTPQGAIPAFFTSQRTRLNVGFTGHRFKLFTAIQDVRVWGQDASSINRTTNDAFDGLMLHEAWAEISLLDTSAAIENLSLKVGRQELVYDDVRVLGNLDWLQQARRHDLALLKFADKGWNAHLGVAFNQNAETKTGLPYNGVPTGYPATTNGLGKMYKSMQFLYISHAKSWGTPSFLVLKDDFNKYILNGTTPVNQRGVWSRVTVGGNIPATLSKRLSIYASGYYQTGKDKDGNKLAAYLGSFSTMYALSKKFSIGPGIDITSGNDGTKQETVNRRFDPLYGTPHKFWGYMDYFYVADGFGKNGLVDYYIRSKFKPKEKLLITLDAHQFAASNKIMGGDGKTLNSNFGTELDLVLNYNLTKIVGIEMGYATMFATPTLASLAVKNIPNADLQSNWAYLMLNIKPDFLAK